MWNWLKSLFRRHDSREIFSFWDGVRERRADPITLYRGLSSHKDYNLENDIPATVEGDPTAHALTVRVVREVFDVPGWSEDSPGLTERETVELLWQFDGYLESLKKSTNLTLISRPAMEPPPSESSLTSSESDSGSTSHEAKSDKPTECLEPLAVP